ncbi:MAG: thermonuclease family protein [Melioribacteraceae bacterium]|nr:thermonuclease family protein [Melioribacteraceae bacterium]MCF8354010.1 thermonuclease family protein [Melioribacteraceae bacterium]MCF8392309.1 thermonuclease family protein [Melioribacteraceae bacterium]MCF8417641.1 thermonuclease family protein [Melioribacteraceae bacterium]
MQNKLYLYRANVVKVYDGDTVTVDIDLGFKTLIKGEKIRLHGINAPEIRGEERNAGLKSRDFLREMILDKDVIIETVKDKKGKYGRYLGKIFVEENGKIINVNDELVRKGLAVYKEY